MYNDGSMSRANGPCPLTTNAVRSVMAAKESTKTCNTCGQGFPRSEFFKDSSKPDGLRKSCKTCTNKSHRSYVDKNREFVASYKAAWWLPRAEKLREAARANYKKNAEHAKFVVSQWAKANREKVRAIKRKWKRLNPEYERLDAAARRLVAGRATPVWADLGAILRVYDEAKSNGLTVDHIVPLRSSLVCGLHCPDNLRAIPLSENASKGNRHWPDMP